MGVREVVIDFRALATKGGKTIAFLCGENFGVGLGDLSSGSWSRCGCRGLGVGRRVMMKGDAENVPKFVGD